MLKIESLQGFYITQHDGCVELSYCANPDRGADEFVEFIDAGDTLVEIVTAALEFTPGQGT